MNDEKKSKIRALNKLVQKWGDSPNTMYYVYSYYDSRCSNEFHQDFEEFNNLPEALHYVGTMEKEQYVVSLIMGEELEV